MARALSPTKLHWNYFLALEQDMERLSRYVELAPGNFGVFSIELARLLFAAASEVDVVAKLLCAQLEPSASRGNINDYKAVLLAHIPDLPTSKVYVPRFALGLEPWSVWATAANPDWWRSYNNVKHERDAYFDEATLKNALHALAALFVLVFHYYSHKLAAKPGTKLPAKETMRLLDPETTLLCFDESFYYGRVIV